MQDGFPLADQSPLPGRSALVLYGSETGNAQDVAEELGRIAERLRFSAQVKELNAIDVRELVQHNVVLIAISTTGQGDLPANAQTLWKKLRSKRLPVGCLQRVRFASFGLGDTSYPQFNWAHRKLYNRLVQLGAQPICDRGESDEQHPEGLDGCFLPWSIKLKQRLLEDYPLPECTEVIPDDVLLHPKWILDFVEPLPAGDSNLINEVSPHTAPTEPDEEPNSGETDATDIPPPDLLAIPNGQTATILTNDRVTPTTHWQDVRHLILRLPETSYSPGDVVYIHPKNFPSDVSHFLDIMGWTSYADKPLKLIPNPSIPNAAPTPPPPLTLPANGPLTLRTLLTNHSDIMSIPRRSFFALLTHFTTDPDQKFRLQEFTDPALVDELYDYTTRPRRSILEVLQEFETVRVPPSWALALLPAMRARGFSVASGGALKTQLPSLPPTTPEAAAAATGAEDTQKPPGTRVDLLIAIVKYRTVIRRIRQGVCTRYIAALPPGSRLTITLQKGGLHIDRARSAYRPVIMVGPGTGVAPMRALAYERRAWWAEDDANRAKSQRNDEKAKEGGHASPNTAPEKPNDILFLGARNRAADFFFATEWPALPRLAVHPAFSRDQAAKVYVQDRIRAQAAAVWRAVGERGGAVYVCGASGRMPQAVREALVECFVSEGRLGRERAEGFLAELERGGRYVQETW